MFYRSVSSGLLLLAAAAGAAHAAPEIRFFINGGHVDDGGSFAFAPVVGLGATTDAGIIIRNSGDDLLYVAGLQTTGPFSVTRDITGLIRPGQQAFGQVRWTSGTIPTDTGTIRLVNNDPDENPYNITLSGTVSLPEPEIQVFVNGTPVRDGGSVDFGTNEQITVRRSVLVRNTGTGSLWVGTNTTTGPFEFIDGVTGTLTPASDPAGAVSWGVLEWDGEGTGANMGTAKMINNDSDENPFNISLTGTALGPPEIRVFANGVPVESGDRYEMGTHGPDETVNVTLTIKNTGTGSLGVSSIATQTEDSTLPAGTFSVPNSDSFIILAGETAFVKATWRPSGSGGREIGNIFIANFDEDEPIYLVELAGTSEVAAPEIRAFFNGSDAADGGTVTFNAPAGTPFGTQVPRAFQIRNIGNTPLWLGNMTISGPFALTGLRANTTLAAGESANGVITWTRTDARSGGPNDTGALKIINNDSDENPFNLSLRGVIVPARPGGVMAGGISDEAGFDGSEAPVADLDAGSRGWEPDAPAIMTFPEDGAELTAGLNQLSWTPVANADGYRVYLSSELPISEDDYAGTVDRASTGPVVLDPETVYYWRIDPILADGNWVPRGETRSFLTPKARCVADVDQNGVLDASDVIAFVNAASTKSLAADIAEPKGTLDADDIITFLGVFSAGCD